MRRTLCGLVLFSALLDFTACGSNNSTTDTIRPVKAHPAVGKMQGVTRVKVKRGEKPQYRCASRMDAVRLTNDGPVKYYKAVIEATEDVTYGDTSVPYRNSYSVRFSGDGLPSFANRAVSLIVLAKSIFPLPADMQVVNLTPSAVRRGIILITRDWKQITELTLCVRR